MSKVSAIFDSHAEAERAVTDLRTLGIGDLDMSVLAHHKGTTTARSADGEVTDEDHTNVLRGILGGGALGAGLGVAALAIPGVGPLVAAGAIASAAIPGAMGVGAAIGAIGGTLNETLVKHGVSEEDADYYNARIKDGGVVVTVEDTDIDEARIREVLGRNGGHNASNARAVSF